MFDNVEMNFLLGEKSNLNKAFYRLIDIDPEVTVFSPVTNHP